MAVSVASVTEHLIGIRRLGLRRRNWRAFLAAENGSGDSRRPESWLEGGRREEEKALELGLEMEKAEDEEVVKETAISMAR